MLWPFSKMARIVISNRQQSEDLFTVEEYETVRIWFSNQYRTIEVTDRKTGMKSVVSKAYVVRVDQEEHEPSYKATSRREERWE